MEAGSIPALLHLPRLTYTIPQDGGHFPMRGGTSESAHKAAGGHKSASSSRHGGCGVATMPLLQDLLTHHLAL